MDFNDSLMIRPDDVNDASARLAELADRVKRVMDAEAANLTVVASARDEVSQRVAATLNQVHTSFTKASDQGHQQLHGVATTLRTHADQVAATDQARAL